MTKTFELQVRSGLWTTKTSHDLVSLDDVEKWRRWMEETPNWRTARVSFGLYSDRKPCNISILGYAIVYRRVQLVRLFLEGGANPNERFKNGISHLHLCYWKLDFEVNQGRRLSVDDCTTQIVQLLMLHGVDMNGTDDKGRSAMHYACCDNSNAHFLRLLLIHGATPNVRDRHGCTPLMDAAARGNSECLSILLQPYWGVNLKVRSCFGRTPLCLAVQSKSNKAAHILIEHGARVVHDENSTCPKDTALDLLPFAHAVEDGNVELTYIFLRQVVAARSQPFAWMSEIARKELPNGNIFHNLALEIRYNAPWNQYKK